MTMRVSPKTKFCLDLVARHQHRSISGVVMAAVEPLFKNPDPDLLVSPEDNSSDSGKAFIGDVVWDPHPTDRLVKLAMRMPSLLTPDEEWIWKIIQESPEAWFKDGERRKTPDFEAIRKGWDFITEVAASAHDKATKAERPGE